MFDRFTDTARKVMALAGQEAQSFNHEYIGTEHILLALVKEGSGVGATLLLDRDIDLSTIRREIQKLSKSGPDMVATDKRPQTPRAKKAIEYAIEESRVLGFDSVTTAHLLLGLLREEDGVAGIVLEKFDVLLEEVRAEVSTLKHVEAGQVYEIPPPLRLLIDPGDASAEELSQLYIELSCLYRMLGGSGITFVTSDAREGVTA